MKKLVSLLVPGLMLSAFTAGAWYFANPAASPLADTPDTTLYTEVCIIGDDGEALDSISLADYDFYSDSAYYADLDSISADFTDYSALRDPDFMEYWESVGEDYPLMDADSLHDLKEYDKLLALSNIALRRYPGDGYATGIKTYVLLSRGKTRQALGLMLPYCCTYPYGYFTESMDPERWATRYPDIAAECLEKIRPEISQGDSALASQRLFHVDLLLARCYAVQGQGQRALKQLDRCETTWPDINYIGPRIYVYQKNDRWDLSKAMMDTLFNNGTMSTFYFDDVAPYAMAMRNNGDLDGAVKAWEIFLAQSEYVDYNGAENLALNYTLQGRYSEALDLLNAAMDSLQSDCYVRPYDEKSTYKRLGLRTVIALNKSGDLNGAHTKMMSVLGVANADELQKLADAPVEDLSDLYMMAFGGEKQLAAKRLEQMVADRETFDMAPSSLASLYAATGDDDKALQYLEEAFRVHNFTPRQVKHDIVLRHLIDDPRYPETAKAFNTDL